jgi:hypothetical protein
MQLLDHPIAVGAASDKLAHDVDKLLNETVGWSNLREFYRMSLNIVSSPSIVPPWSTYSAMCNGGCVCSITEHMSAGCRTGTILTCVDHRKRSA